MALAKLVIVGLSLSPYEFIHSLVFHRKKKGLLDEYLSQGKDIEGIIHSQRRWERRYGRLREKITTVQYSYSLLNETYKREVALPCHLPRKATTIALKVLPEKYPESACPILLLKGHKQNLSNMYTVACYSFLAFVGVNIASLLILVLILDVAHESITKRWSLITTYLLILIIYTVLGYPCALIAFRHWRQSLIVKEPHASDAGYQLVKSAANESTSRQARTMVSVQEISHHSLSLDLDGESDAESDDDKKRRSRIPSSEMNEGIIPTCIV